MGGAGGGVGRPRNLSVGRKRSDENASVMYGLLLESLVEHIKIAYGDDKWDEIRKAAGVEQTTFSTHNVYPESLVTRLAKAATEVSRIT